MTQQFTTPCFIRKNKPELRKNLEELGYKLNHGKWMGEIHCYFPNNGNKGVEICCISRMGLAKQSRFRHFHRL